MRIHEDDGEDEALVDRWLHCEILMMVETYRSIGSAQGEANAALPKIMTRSSPSGSAKAQIQGRACTLHDLRAIGSWPDRADERLNNGWRERTISTSGVAGRAKHRRSSGQDGRWAAIVDAFGLKTILIATDPAPKASTAVLLGIISLPASESVNRAAHWSLPPL
jgi:hypothetical protein